MKKGGKELKVPHHASTAVVRDGNLPYIIANCVTDLINRIIQVLKRDLYWVKISTQNTKLIKPVKLWDEG